MIIGISDVHGKLEALSVLSEVLSVADLVVLSGDITHFGSVHDAERVIESIRRLNETVFAVSGNCDYPEVDHWLVRKGISLHGRCIVMDQIALIGVGGSLPAPGGTPNEYSEKELGFFLEEAARDLPQDKTVVMVSHQPPFNTVCDLVHGRHVGSLEVRKFIEKYQPALCLCGHIHEGRGVGSIGRTKVANPGPLRDGTYMRAEVDSGVRSLRLVRGHSILWSG